MEIGENVHFAICKLQCQKHQGKSDFMDSIRNILIGRKVKGKVKTQELICKF